MTTNAEGATAIAASPVGSVFCFNDGNGTSMLGVRPGWSSVHLVALHSCRYGRRPATVTAGKTYFAEVIAVASTTNVATYTLAGFTAPDGDHYSRYCKDREQHSSNICFTKT